MLCSELLKVIKGKQVDSIIFTPGCVGLVFRGGHDNILYRKLNNPKVRKFQRTINSATIQDFLSQNKDHNYSVISEEDGLRLGAGDNSILLPVERDRQVVDLPLEIKRPDLTIELGELRKASKVITMFLTKQRGDFRLSIPYLINSLYFSPKGFNVTGTYAQGTDGRAMMLHKVNMQLKRIQISLPYLLDRLLRVVDAEDKAEVIARKHKVRTIMNIGEWFCSYPSTTSPSLLSARLSDPVNLIFSSDQLTSAAAKALQFQMGQGVSVSSNFGEPFVDLNLQGKSASMSCIEEKTRKRRLLTLPFKVKIKKRIIKPVTLRLSWPMLQKVTKLCAWRWEVRLASDSKIIEGYPGPRFVTLNPIVLKEKSDKITCVMMPHVAN